MRVVRVLSESYGRPRAAIERDGVLYDVERLEAAFAAEDGPSSVSTLGDPSDFHTRVATLRCAGLHDLDVRLLRGARPSSARIPDDDAMRLAPCDTERAAVVCVEPMRGAPRCRTAQARAVLGQDALVSVEADEAELSIGLAALLGEDLSRATAREAAGAVLGFAILVEWTARGGETRWGSLGAQLGPALVSRYALPRPESAEAHVVVGGARRSLGRAAAQGLGLDEAIAFASGEAELRAGDVVALTAWPASLVAPLHEPVTVELQGVGALRGTAVPRRPHTTWRAARSD